MNNTSFMQELQCKHNFSHIRSSPLLGKRTKGFDQSGTITAIEIFHHQVQIFLALECKVKLDHKGRLRLLHKDHAFGFDVGNLILGNHVRLFENLDSIVIASRLLLGQEDGAESAFADWFDDVKVFDGGRRRLGSGSH